MELSQKAIEALDQARWRVIVPSLYSDTWVGSGNDLSIEVIRQYFHRFGNVYIEEGAKLNSITLLQHAIEALGISEYYLCDFESIDDVKGSIENAYFVDKNHANAKYAEYKINDLFVTKLSKSIKQYAIANRTAIYKQNLRGVGTEQLSKLQKGWYMQVQNYFVLLPTIAGLYWIVKAERNIQAHDPKSIHRIYVQYKKDNIDFSITYETAYTDEYIQERNDAIDFLQKNPHKVSSYQTEVQDKKPRYKPVVLSFLQSKMFYLYHFSIEYSTKIVRRLHQAGLITDPMTSSYFIPGETSIEIIRMLNDRYGEEYVLQYQRDFKCSDEGKTAILPTHFEEAYYPEHLSTTPEFLKINFESATMRKDALIMYYFIHAITEWIQMKDAIYDTSILQIQVGNRKLEAKAHNLVDVYDPQSGGNIKQTSWESVHQDLLKAMSSTAGEVLEEDMIVVLPKCAVNETLQPTNIHFTVTTPKRPPRYGVGRFNIEILGAKGIGTAESFHIIQNNLVSSGIVVLANNMMHPQDIAIETVEWCEKYFPELLDESQVQEYWDRLGRIRFEEDDPQQLINEYQFMIDEALKASGYSEKAFTLTEAQINRAKSIARKRGIKIDNPERFFSDYEAVKKFLDHAAADESKEEEKLFKCPVCKKGYVYLREYVDEETHEVSPYYTCEHYGCFRIYDKKIEDFFLHKKKELNAEERLQAIKNIASKHNLKSPGYQYTDFKNQSGKRYKAKVLIDTYLNGKKNICYTLKVKI